MKLPYVPREIVDWRSSGLVLFVIVTPLASLALLARENTNLGSVASLDSLLLSPASLAAAVTTYVAYRIRPHREAGWLAVVLAILSVQTLSVSALQVAVPGIDHHHLYPRLTELIVVGVMTTCIVLAGRMDVPTDPLALGLVLGTVLGFLRLAAVAELGPVELPVWSRAILGVLLLGTIVMLAVFFVRFRRIPSWAKWRLAAVAILIGLAELGHAFTRIAAAADIASLVADTLAAVMLCLTGLAILRQAIADDEADHEHLCAQLHHYQADSRAHRARMHEVNSTLAGISCATTLIHSEGEVPQQRRAVLETMVDAELARLTRLLSSPGDGFAPSGTRLVDFDVDEVLRPVVLAHQTRGHRVAWEPSGRRVTGDPDQLAEVVNILLDNAEKHGGPDVFVETVNGAADVEIRVTDSGPGVAEGVALFQWGARGPTSRGQGIGLHIAQELMDRQRGYLRLHRSAEEGTTFALGLQHAYAPAQMRTSGASTHIA